MPKGGSFIFTITDLARFLGKSSVTIRKWEKQGLISLPRDTGDNRKLTVDEVRDVAKKAFHLGRIRRNRLDLIEAACTVLSLVEGE